MGPENEMDRFTEKTAAGNVLELRYGSVPPWSVVTKGDGCRNPRYTISGYAIDLLAAYADAGLPPKRCAELAEADKDGRLVVMPCRDWLDIVFGEQVSFRGVDKSLADSPILKISVDNADRITWYDGWKTVAIKGFDENWDEWEICGTDIGKTVFLTREEAEQALRGVKGDG